MGFKEGSAKAVSESVRFKESLSLKIENTCAYSADMEVTTVYLVFILSLHVAVMLSAMLQNERER